MGFSLKSLFSGVANLFLPKSQGDAPTTATPVASGSGTTGNFNATAAQPLPPITPVKANSTKPDGGRSLGWERDRALPPIPKPDLSEEQQRQLEELQARMRRNRNLDLGR